MKKIFIFILSCTIYLSAVTSGIYKIDDSIDYALLKKSFKPFDDTNNRYVKASHKVNYENMIDKDMHAHYAIIVHNAKDEYGSTENKVILLNTADSKNRKNVSYSDQLIRKYTSLNFKVDSKTIKGKKYWYSTGSNTFYAYSYELATFATTEYERRVDDNRSYTTLYDQDIYREFKNMFILKSYNMKSFMLTSKREEPRFSFFDSRLKEATYKIIQQASIFRIQTPRNYIDILRIPKKISFQADKKEYVLHEGDFLAITKEDDEWYYGDFVYPNGKYISGKINKDSLLFDASTHIQDTKNHKLKILYSTNKQSFLMSATREIYAIRSYDKNNKKIQTIRNAGYLTNENYTLNMIDVNFDGYSDMMIYSHDGGAGPNSGYNFYVYNPKSKRFEYNQTLSDLTQTQVNTKAKKITAAWRNGAAEHGYEEYKWINGNPIMTKQIVETYLDEDKIRTVTCINENSKLKCKTKITKDHFNK